MSTLDKKTIDQICEKLSHFLADNFVLYVKTLNFHWNMVGSEFYMYHKLLEEQYDELQDANDELAERIRMLGQKAPGSMKDFIRLSSLKESETKLSAKQMIQELVNAHQSLVEHCHGLVQFTEGVNDQGTADLLIQRMRSHAKQGWLLRSHLEA